MANKSKSGWLKWLILVVGLGGVGGGVWYYRSQGEGVTEYQTTKVTRGDLTQAVTATGQLNPVLNVQVGSQISGIIERLYADFNSTVTNGQVIAQLDAATYQANVSSAEGELASSQASLELAQINARRAAELFKNKLIAQSEHDQSVATLHQAEAQVRIRAAALERARVDLGRCTIYSPVEGIVISRNVDVGQTVAASMSAPTLFIIANDLAKMQIDANVAEADVGGVEVGQEVDFTVDAYPYRTFRGKVVQVRNSPITVQNVVSYDTVIEVNNADLKLKPGMTATVSIIIARKENALKLPNAALRFKPAEIAAVESKTNPPPPAVAEAARSSGGGQRDRGAGGGGRRSEGVRPSGGGNPRPRAERPLVRTIYVVPADTKPGGEIKPQPVQVKVGVSDGAATEIIEGLNEGDVVITAAITSDGASGQRPATNPFGGGSFRAGFEATRFAVDPQPVIQLEAIRKTYHTGEVDVHAVRGVSLRVQRGEFIAVMGASGSGKSTLMNLIGCLDRPTGGQYQLDGIDVSTLARDELADVRNEKIGFVFQGFNLLARTSALENVEMPMLYQRQRLPARAQRERAQQSLELVGLGARAGHLPNQLSGGQQQRVAIARALVNRPALLLADEPTGNLDSQTSIEIMGVFQKLNDQGITIVMVTHELDIASYAKRTVVLRDGRIVTDEPVKNRLGADVELRRLQEAQQAINLSA